MKDTMMFFFSCDPKINPSPFHPSNFNSTTMVCIRKAKMDDLLAMQACNQPENYQQIKYFFYQILSRLQFLHVGGKNVDFHGHNTSLSVLSKLGLEIKLLTAAQNAMKQTLQMESSALHSFKFEMKAPIFISFLTRFVHAAQGVNEEEAPLKCLAYYISEFSLLEYDMLCYPPSLVAASAIFLARYVLFPSHKPWNSTLRDYTQYQPSDLYECVKALHALVTECPNPKLPEIREKYSKDEYKCVADKYSCPPTIPLEHFHNISTPQLSY